MRSRKRSERFSVNEEKRSEGGEPSPGTEGPGKGPLLLIGAIVVAAIVGGLASRGLAPVQPSPSPSARPIVQLVRQQAGLPDLSDLIDRLCPSVASIGSPAIGSEGKPKTLVPSFAVSTDGWLLTSAPPPSGANSAVFGDGRTASLEDFRTDPVSGLTIVKAEGATLQPLAFSDQLFPRVGQFGIALQVPADNGCSASSAMVASDFLADGRGLVGYVRVQAISPGWTSGSPFVGSDGRVVGIASGFDRYRDSRTARGEHRRRAHPQQPIAERQFRIPADRLYAAHLDQARRHALECWNCVGHGEIGGGAFGARGRRHRHRGQRRTRFKRIGSQPGARCHRPLGNDDGGPGNSSADDHHCPVLKPPSRSQGVSAQGAGRTARAPFIHSGDLRLSTLTCQPRVRQARQVLRQGWYQSSHCSGGNSRFPRPSERPSRAPAPAPTIVPVVPLQR